MYNPYLNQFNYSNQMQSAIPQTPVTIVRVNGKNGAEAYMIPANSNVLLLDETAPIVWLKQTDGAGYPTITGYKIEPIKEEVQVTQTSISDLEERLTKLEKLLND